jgi:hypothetical protein
MSGAAALGMVLYSFDQFRHAEPHKSGEKIIQLPEEVCIAVYCIGLRKASATPLIATISPTRAQH